MEIIYTCVAKQETPQGAVITLMVNPTAGRDGQGNVTYNSPESITLRTIDPDVADRYRINRRYKLSWENIVAAVEKTNGVEKTKK